MIREVINLFRRKIDCREQLEPENNIYEQVKLLVLDLIEDKCCEGSNEICATDIANAMFHKREAGFNVPGGILTGMGQLGTSWVLRTVNREIQLNMSKHPKHRSDEILNIILDLLTNSDVSK